MKAKNEAVNHPAHYGGENNPYEAIKVIEAWDADFCIGNTLKYLARAGKKNGQSSLQDLQKAKWYLDRKIQQLLPIEKQIEEKHHIDFTKFNFNSRKNLVGKNVAPVKNKRLIKKRKK